MKRGILILLTLVVFGAVVAVSDSASPDTDRDGILDSLDACPQIPAKDAVDGCPRFTTHTPNEDNLLFMTPRFQIAENTALNFRQKTELRFNDEIKAVLYDPKTGEIFSESNMIKVGN